MSAKTDFDFLIGNWEIKNKRLKERLINSNEWIEFNAKLTGSKKILNDSALMDQFVFESNGETFEGISLRIFDPKTEEWTIYWFDSDNPKVSEQVVGTFEDGIGTFYGNELFQVKSVKIRFIWSNITDSTARWEQAYFDENNNEWETNWIMDFSRIK